MRTRFLASMVVVCVTASLSAQELALYQTDFTSLEGWTVTTGCAPDYEWAADATPAGHPAGPYFSAPASLNFNDGEDIGGGGGGHGGGSRGCGSVLSLPIDLSVADSPPKLRFLASWDMEGGCEFDVLSLRVISATDATVLYSNPCVALPGTAPWHMREFPLDSSWGSVRFEFGFDTIDGEGNWYSGPFIDDLEVVYTPASLGSTVCAGDGSGAACPCGNSSTTGHGCANSTGGGARLVATGSAGVAAGDLVLSAAQLRPNQFGTFMQGDISLGGGDGIPFGDGLRCAGNNLVRLQQVQSSAGGSSSTSVDIAAAGGVAPGDTRTYQLWYRDPGSPCASHFNLTNGIELAWLP